MNAGKIGLAAFERPMSGMWQLTLAGLFVAYSFPWSSGRNNQRMITQ